MIGGAAELDRRFSESYDPKLDVQMNEPSDAWDDQVEAFRDQQKLRLHQAQRMQDAGFTDEQIQQATEFNARKTEPPFVWSKVGERREWDKGKAVGMEAMLDDEDIAPVEQAALFSDEY